MGMMYQESRSIEEVRSGPGESERWERALTEAAADAPLPAAVAAAAALAEPDELAAEAAAAATCSNPNFWNP